MKTREFRRQCAARDRACTSDLKLRTWLQTFLGLTCPPAAVCRHHNTPFDYLRHVYFEPAKDVVVWAPRGGGKTRLGAAATMMDLLHKPGVQARILAGSLAQTRRMWEHLLDDAKRLALELMDDSGCDGVNVKLDSGSRVGLLTQSQKAVRGLRIQKLRCDEVEQFDRAVWEAAQMVTRRGGMTRAVLGPRPPEAREEPVSGVVEVLSTYHEPWGVMKDVLDNAKARDIKVIKWCILDVLERCPPERDCSTCLLREECGGVAKDRCDGFFSIDDAIRFKQRLSVDKWKTEMLCEKPNTSGCVFPTFGEAVHVKEGDPPAGRMWLAIDFGFANPFVCLWVVDGEDGSVHVVDEYVQPGRTVEEHVGQIEARPWGKVTMVACDPAGSGRNDQTAESNVSLLRRKGYKVHKRGSLIQDGLEKIRFALKSAAGEVRLFIRPNCTKLIEAMQAYHYAPGGSEVPVKDGSDHLVDALRYFFVNRGRQETRGGRAY